MENLAVKLNDSTIKLSVIIPTYNEAEVIAKTVRQVFDKGNDLIEEVIVVDGGSSDETVSQAQQAGATVIDSPSKGRAAQMNRGAEHATGDILYFLHADSRPPANFAASIHRSITTGSDAGCFRLAFDDDHWLLTSYAWFSRFDIDFFRFGDQSLFIKREVFAQLRGFREDHIVMEDQEMVRRIKSDFSFTILDGAVVTSARKYHKVGILKLQLIFSLILTLYYLGVSQERLVGIYKGLIQ
ncbi:TIGR04283 family arsenosugar biosynthesis glycosyltransferase [Fodinibius salsisoli]|uniref:TIGR04283 family arsenosugar biosynthesis glycosyltransferase n=1 Tax=Fodinibius salsisoli TaxID=2820877 RepID=A0ABT3PSA8_9BACT|nr:TIGR04283 family arsenosugar biosynthesis glycosyltransferase [Fodinibius salsisoli]